MTKFSLGDDDDPPPNPTAKRPRATASAASTSRPRTRSRTSAQQEVQHYDELYLEWLTTRMVALEEGIEEELVENMDNLDGGEAGPSSDSSVSITLTDPDVLDCPVCLEPLAVPVFQCENGHIACSSCCGKLKNRCPSCCLPIGYNRCRAIEKVVESAKVSCLNSKYGCIERVTYYKKHEHELTCIHAPCACPATFCSYVGSAKNLYLHHANATGHFTLCFTFNQPFYCHLRKHEKYICLQEKNEKVIFVLNRANTDLGSVVNVNCIGPNVMNKKFVYGVLATDGGEMFVQSELIAESVSKWVEHVPEKAFLVIPPGFVTLGGLVTFQMCIKKNHEVPTSC